MDEPLYLIKFFSEAQFAQKLVDCGELYMRPAEYYIQLEYNSSKSKQGDKFEGACSHRVGIAKGVNHPIYCMMQIMSGDIKKDATGRPFVHISASLLQDFFPCPENGAAVIIPYREFISRLNPSVFSGSAYTFGSVRYGYINSLEALKYLLKDGTMTSLFIKRPEFSYQQEFRICVSKDLPIAPKELKDSHLLIQLGDFSHIAQLKCYRHFVPDDEGYRLYLS